MKTLTLLTILTFSLSCFAQYIPFPTSNTTWTCANGEGMSGTYNGNIHFFILNGDTLISGKHYSKLFYSQSGTYDTSYFVCGIREDSTKKVWYSGLRNSCPPCYYLNYEGDTSEYLLYNFGMNIGDTITLYNPNMITSNSNPYSKVLTDTSSQFFATKLRKVYHCNNMGNLFDNNFLEGVGSVEGILAPLMEDFEIFNTMLCFNGYVNIFTGSTWEILFGGPSPCLTELAIDENETNQINLNSFYPNPSNGIIYLKNNTTKVKIFSASGQFIYESNKLDKKQLDLSFLTKGMYIIKFDSNNLTNFKKLIICK